MNSRLFMWAACLLAAFLIATPALCAEGESTSSVSAGGSATTGGSGTTSSTSTVSTSINTSGGDVVTQEEATTTTTVGTTTSVSSSEETSSEGTEEESAAAPEKSVEEEAPVESLETPAEGEATAEGDAAAEGEEPAQADNESSEDDKIVSETVSDDGSQVTKAATDTEGTEADAVAITTGDAGEGPVTAKAVAQTSDEGARADAESTKGDEVQKDTVETAKPDQGEESYEPETSGEEEDTEAAKDLNADDFRLCEGLSKFLCCDDKDFLEENGNTFCGCWGSDSSQGCSFKVVQKENPLAVQDLSGLRAGQMCKCQAPDAIENQCFGRTKDECCENVDPNATKCKCIFDDLCVYEKVSDGVWKDTLFNTGDCVCPPK